MTSRKRVSKTVLILSISTCLVWQVGCQSWSAGGYSMQNASRVPPPATGTYQLPSAYYNGGGGQASNATQNANSSLSARGVSAAPPVGSPLTGVSSTNVQPAGYMAPAGANYPVNGGSAANYATTASPVSPNTGFQSGAGVTTSNLPTIGGASASLSDTSQVPSLGWQP